MEVVPTRERSEPLCAGDGDFDLTNVGWLVGSGCFVFFFWFLVMGKARTARAQPRLYYSSYLKSYVLCVAGRAIDGDGGGGGIGAGGAAAGAGGARPALHRPASNSSIGSMGSLSRCMSEVRADVMSNREFALDEGECICRILHGVSPRAMETVFQSWILWKGTARAPPKFLCRCCRHISSKFFERRRSFDSAVEDLLTCRENYVWK